MPKFTSLVALLIFPAILFSQSAKYTAENGRWSFYDYGPGVIKVVFQPNEYKTNELITDAVVAKAWQPKVLHILSEKNKSTVKTNVPIRVNGDSLFIGIDNLVTITGTHQSNAYRGFHFLLDRDEKIFGGGERALPLDRRGYKFNLYNNPHYGYGMGAANLNYSVPFVTSSKLYGLFFDNASKGYLDIGKKESNVLEYGTISGELNFYVITGKDYQEILSRYHKLTGTQPVPPRWAMGNFLSRFGYVSETQTRSIMQQMRNDKIPYDAVIYDLFWFGDSIKGTMGNLEWVNKKAWPNPKQMIMDFKKDGTQTVLITEPFVVKSSIHFDVSKKFHAVDSAGLPYLIKDFYFGEAGLIDIFRKDSKDWFWTKYKAQMLNGVEGWWGDLGEPEKHPSDIYHNLRDLGFKRLFGADEVHNAYGHYWTKMLFDKYAKEYPNKRLFSLNRSGFAGTQRYGIFPWTGDVSRSWDGLKAQLPVLLGMSMSGVPYVHSDAGGFAGGAKDEELYVRWLQFAAYTPIFRPHGTELSPVDTTTANFPSEPALHPEPYRSIAKDIVDERYALLPYNYTLSYQQSKYGRPLISPLYYYFSSDTNTCHAEDEFMWGQNMLVAPVLEKGATYRKLYLPKGVWYNNRTFNAVEGGRWTTDTVDLTHIPVYLREGSFIPYVGKPVKNTSGYSTKELMITYVPSRQSSSFEMYDDDGKTNHADHKNLFELINFTCNGWSNETVITMTSNKGKFAGKPVIRNINLAIPGLDHLPSHVTINGKRITQGANQLGYSISWNDRLGAAFIKFPFSGKTVKIVIK